MNSHGKTAFYAEEDSCLQTLLDTEPNSTWSLSAGVENQRLCSLLAVERDLHVRVGIREQFTAAEGNPTLYIWL